MHRRSLASEGTLPKATRRARKHVRGELEMSSGDAQVISSQKGWQITPVGGREFNSRKAPFKAKVYHNEEAMLDDGSAESATKNVIGDFLDRCIDRNPNALLHYDYRKGYSLA